MKKPFDEICTLADCPNLSVCVGLCAPLTWVDGNKKLKEKLLRDPPDLYRNTSYNDVLATLIEGRRVEHIDQIRELPDKRLRCIAACLYADISVREIAGLLHLSKPRLYEIINGK